MSVIKRIAPKTCPDCGMDGVLFLATDRKLTCRMCGYKNHRGDATEKQQTNPDEDPRSKWQVTYGTPNSHNISRWAKVKYNSGLDYTRQGNYDDALRAFEQALDLEHDFVDAHIWVARLSLDPKVKREHYGEVIAMMPMNTEAQRELMVIKGDLTREEADRAVDMSAERDIQDAQAPVGVKMVEIVCSSCGGTLEARTDQAHVTCQYCGHKEQIQHKSESDVALLSAAMIKERAQGTTWRVGQFLLHCDNCGSERIITSKKMTAQCPFCGSKHVIRADALDSFRQPDGIVPFSIQQKIARSAIDEELAGFKERMKGFFVNNRVESLKLLPVYLPFWYFDVTAKITITTVDTRSARDYAEIMSRRNDQRQLHDGLNNVPYCAVESPSHRLTDRLESFELASTKPYDPKLLAGFTAEIYAIDYQQASLNVRNEIGERFRFRHGHDPHGDVQKRVNYFIQQMTFRLLMMPLWVATITEADGDIRLGLVHGQTGQVILGNAQRPPK